MINDGLQLTTFQVDPVAAGTCLRVCNQAITGLGF